MDILLRRPTLLAAIRWLFLLSENSNLPKARGLLRNRAEYVDLTLSQYSEALEWLQNIGAVTFSGDPADVAIISSPWLEADEMGVRQLVLQAAVLEERPTWVEDAGDLVVIPEDLPLDLLKLSEALGLETIDAFDVFHLVSGKIDLEARTAVGEAGERTIFELLTGLVADGTLPSDTVLDWISLRNDAAGYDIAVRSDGAEWLFEVKTTVRRSRFRLYLTRNEFEVARVRSAHWHLLTVLLSKDLNTLLAVGSNTVTYLEPLMPRDMTGLARWEDTRIDLPTGAAYPGLPLPIRASVSIESIAATGLAANEPRPSWLASRNSASA